MFSNVLKAAKLYSATLYIFSVSLKGYYSIVYTDTVPLQCLKDEDEMTTPAVQVALTAYRKGHI